jgi:hypothetical protein
MENMVWPSCGESTAVAFGQKARDTTGKVQAKKELSTVLGRGIKRA